MGEGANGRNGETAKRLKTGAKWGLGQQRRHRRAEFFALPACSSDQHIRCYSPFRPFAASPFRRFAPLLRSTLLLFLFLEVDERF